MLHMQVEHMDIAIDKDPWLTIAVALVLAVLRPLKTVRRHK